MGPSHEVDSLLKPAIFLLLPFVLGFSTSLVIMILNRLVGGVQAFFGKTEMSSGSHATLGGSHSRSSIGRSR
jgi:hypothetical protein